MSDQPRDPELEHLLDLTVEVALDSVYVGMPGQVVSYDSKKQSASIQPLVQKSHISEIEERVVQTLPVIHGVPVLFFGGGGGRITVPVKAGDVGWLHFSSLSIARWKLRGGITDPGDDRRHDLNDCVFHPGAHSTNAPPTDAPTDAVCTHGSTRLGDSLATDSKYDVVIRDCLTHFMTILAGVTDSAGANAALHTALVSAGWPDRLSQLVKAK